MPPQLENPIKGRAIISWPTPVISDNIINEFVSSETGQYQPLEYGTKWDAVEHTSFQIAYPGYQLVYQAPADTNGFLIRRVWCNPRINQQTYDYSITYAEEDPAYPIVTRLKVVKRSEYTPEAALTPDVTFTNSLLVQERMLNQTTPEEINSLYVTVASIYEPIPGPVVQSQDFDPELRSMVTTKRQVVLSTDTFNPNSVPLLLQAQESPQSKYKKLRAYSYLESLPASFTETSNGTYNFPTLVFDIPLSLYQLTTDPNRSEVYWEFDKEDGPQVPAILTTTTSFSNGEPSGESLFVLPIQTLFYRGVSFQITIANVLNDSISVSASFTDDARYGNLAESKNFPASTISASDYKNSYRGTNQTIGCDIKRYRGNLWVKRVTTVLLV